MKTRELASEQLAEWVARANGWRVEPEELPDNPAPICWEPNGDVHSFSEFGYRPDLNWAQGGPIIEREHIELLFDGANWGVPTWLYGGDSMEWAANGSTPLIAAMRAYVASRFGDTVPDA